jgi:serine/threonine-protein kinase
VDSRTTVRARLAKLGIEPTQADARERLGASRGAAPTAVTERALPQISVDLRLPDAALPSPPGAADLEVTGLLGEGGMGRVLLARQHSLDREVAIKTLRAAANADDRASLISEGAITGYLEHPAIVPVHALGFDAAGQPVLVMKRVVGVSWAQLVEDPAHEAWDGPPGDRLEAHLDVLMKVCNAAHFAHSRGVVHRDIKPENVLIGRYGEVYLGDWGLALRLERQGVAEPMCGTPANMAPEMVLGGPVDARTDVYLLGATLHRLLVGTARNPGGLQDALTHALDTEPVRYPPSVPAELGALANRATARDPAARPASALELRQAVADYLLHKSSNALHATAAERLVRLRALLDDEAALASEERQHALDVLAVEARFALEQARREWPEHPAAARSQAELDALLAARRGRAAELERQARELDPRVGGRARAAAAAAIAVCGVALSLTGLFGDPAGPSPRRLFVEALVPLAVALASAGLLVRRLWRTALNRRAAAAVIALLGGIVLSRGLGVLESAPPAHILVADLLLCAVWSAVGGALLFSWLAWLAPLLLASAVVAAAWPGRALVVFELATGGALLLGAAGASLSLRAAISARPHRRPTEAPAAVK